MHTPDPDDDLPHVLVIDDEPTVLRALQRCLRRHFHISCAANGQAAISSLSNGARFDAILCDLAMPGIDGMDLYDWLRHHRPELADRTVFCTGGAITDETARFVERLGRRSVDKTAGSDALRRALEQVLQEHSRSLDHTISRTRSSRPPHHTPVPGA